MKLLPRLVLAGCLMASAALQTRAEGTTPAVAGFSSEQLSSGLKSGLGTIITQALAGGQLDIGAPGALSKIETALTKAGKGEAASGFSTALSEAAAKVAPQATALIQTALKDVKIEDAKALLSGGPDAATQFLKKHAGAPLREKLLPLVKQATASSDLAGKAKAMLAAAGPLAGFGGGKAVADLDGYVTDQVLEKSFALMAKEEAAVRANPALLKDNPLAQKVFALFKK